jgi:hypothetical protein
VDGQWIEFAEDGYRERASWSLDGRRILTERTCQGAFFRHDIWIPTDAEIRTFLGEAGFSIAQAYGGLDGRPWEEAAERWIYRVIKR